MTSVLLGLALILLAHALSRGKRRAWQAALALFAIAAITHVLKGPHPVVVLYSLGMVAGLVWKRHAFPARTDPGSLGAVARFVPTYLLGVVAFGAITLTLESEHVEEPLTVFGVLRATFAGLLGFAGPYEYTGAFFEDFFPAACWRWGSPA